MPTSLANDRRIRLEGARNVRDLGGLPTAHGTSLRRGVILRADNLRALTDEDMNLLTGTHGLRSVIDLRRNVELEAAPNLFRDHETVKYLHMPLFDDPATPAATPSTPRSLEEIYRLLLDTRSEALLAVLRAVINDEHRPTVIHCTAGKDRTGVVIALILGVMGVSAEDIAHDYALTSEALTDEYLAEARVRAERAGYEWSTYQSLLVCPPEFMFNTLAYLEETYGGARAYLLTHGFSEKELSRLEAVLIAEDLA